MPIIQSNESASQKAFFLQKFTLFINGHSIRLRSSLRTLPLYVEGHVLLVRAPRFSRTFFWTLQTLIKEAFPIAFSASSILPQEPSCTPERRTIWPARGRQSPLKTVSRERWEENPSVSLVSRRATCGVQACRRARNCPSVRLEIFVWVEYHQQ